MRKRPKSDLTHIPSASDSEDSEELSSLKRAKEPIQSPLFHSKMFEFQMAKRALLLFGAQGKFSALIHCSLLKKHAKPSHPILWHAFFYS